MEILKEPLVLLTPTVIYFPLTYSPLLALPSTIHFLAVLSIHCSIGNELV